MAKYNNLGQTSYSDRAEAAEELRRKELAAKQTNFSFNPLVMPDFSGSSMLDAKKRAAGAGLYGQTTSEMQFKSSIQNPGVTGAPNANIEMPASSMLNVPEQPVQSKGAIAAKASLAGAGIAKNIASSINETKAAAKGASDAANASKDAANAASNAKLSGSLAAASLAVNQGMQAGPSKNLASSTLAGASAGASLGGPWGAAAGAAIGFAGGAMQNRAERKARKRKAESEKQEAISRIHQQAGRDSSAAFNNLISALQNALVGGGR